MKINENNQLVSVLVSSEGCLNQAPFSVLSRQHHVSHFFALDQNANFFAPALCFELSHFFTLKTQ
jgi:hypothetical protein